MSEAITCTQCGEPVDTLAKGVRLMSKQAMTWRCPLCNTKCSLLSTMFGGWPVEGFKNLSLAEQKEFWASTKAEGWSLKQAVEEQIILRRIKKKWDGYTGEFQPLSWYKNQGYDVNNFSKSLQQEWSTEMGCMTYRVNIHGGGQQQMEEIAREEVNKLMKKPKKDKNQREPAPAENEPATPAGDQEAGPTDPADDPICSSQSSNTTTSSSTSKSTGSSATTLPRKKGGKKEKDGKKEKKEKKQKKDDKKEKARERKRLAKAKKAEKKAREKAKKEEKRLAAEKKKAELEAKEAAKVENEDGHCEWCPLQNLARGLGS